MANGAKYDIWITQSGLIACPVNPAASQAGLGLALDLAQRARAATVEALTHASAFPAWTLAGVLAIAGLCFVAAPYVAFFALRSAADAQDIQGLSQLVDFDAVRAGPEDQRLTPRARPPSRPGSRRPSWQDPIGALKSASRRAGAPSPSRRPTSTPILIHRPCSSEA